MSFKGHLLSSYKYDLPSDLIATRPCANRDHSKLLVVKKDSGELGEMEFKDLVDHLGSNDVIVINNTQVIKARMLGWRLLNEVPSGKIEFFLIQKVGPNLWEGLFKSSAKQVPGLKFQIPNKEGHLLSGEIVKGSSQSPTGTVVCQLSQDPLSGGYGRLPLPPYINRVEADEEDQNRYQTVYHSVPGSVAAPTAGLHFTSELIDRLKQKGVTWVEVTLHVGLGTFRPVKCQDITQHLMHQEQYHISDQAALVLNGAKKTGKNIIAIGTTSARTLESAVKDNKISAGSGQSRLFIYPGPEGQKYDFKFVSSLITNFHLPESTLLMLVCALGGCQNILNAYQFAVQKKYRFFSYGDAMWIR